MTGNFTVISWNVQGEIGIDDTRLKRQLDFLDNYATDIDCFLFQAVNSEEGSTDAWEGHLGALHDYFKNQEYHVAHTGEWAQHLSDALVQPHANIEGAHNRCNLTASRWPIERKPLTLRNRGEGKPRNSTSHV